MNRFKHKQRRDAGHSVQSALRSAASAQQAGSVHGSPQFHLAVAVDDTLHGLRAQMQEAAGQLDTQLSTMKTSRQKQDRARLALSSIEAYRVLVSAVTDNAKIPTEVSLLDYAGFRYDANLKASPIQWDDMARVVSFAHKTWDALSPRAKASPVAVRFVTAIADMDKAVAQRTKRWLLPQ